MKSFFGDCDREKGSSHGKIVNTNPLWTKDKNVADIEDDIRSIERQESNGGFIDGKARARKMARKLKLENTLRQIKASDPRGKIKGRELDDVKNAVESFEEEIKNLNPTRYDEDQAKKGHGTVNPTLQGHHSKRPCIQLKSEKELELAKRCNMVINNSNEVSRDDMTRGLWLLERILGVRPNHNRLKHDVPHGHIRHTNQFQVKLPPEMEKAYQERKATVKKEAVETVDGKPVKTKAKRTGKPWTCPDCETKMTTLEKGLHKRHCTKKLATT